MTDNTAPQPDLALRTNPRLGGQSKIEGNFAAGAPELVVEVSHTTRVKDAGVKLSLYERSGVVEYLIFGAGETKTDLELSWPKGNTRTLPWMPMGSSDPRCLRACG